MSTSTDVNPEYTGKSQFEIPATYLFKRRTIMKKHSLAIRLSAALLAALMLLTVVACGKTDPPAETTVTTAAPVDGTTTATEATTTAPVEVAPTHDENGYLLDDIPEQNHGGQTVTVLVYKEGKAQDRKSVV